MFYIIHHIAVPINIIARSFEVDEYAYHTRRMLFFFRLPFPFYLILSQPSTNINFQSFVNLADIKHNLVVYSFLYSIKNVVWDDSIWDTFSWALLSGSCYDLVYLIFSSCIDADKETQLYRHIPILDVHVTTGAITGLYG